MNAQANTGGAEGALNNTARSRAASIVASASTSAANTALDNAARTRTALINVVTTAVGAFLPHKAAGGSASGLTVVGERGPEVVDLPAGSFVHTANESRALMSGPGRGVGSPARTAEIHIHAGTVIYDRLQFGKIVKEALAAANRAGF
jgi:hypothetical protein